MRHVITVLALITAFAFLGSATADENEGNKGEAKIKLTMVYKKFGETRDTVATGEIALPVHNKKPAATDPGLWKTFYTIQLANLVQLSLRAAENLEAPFPPELRLEEAPAEVVVSRREVGGIPVINVPAIEEEQEGGRETRGQKLARALAARLDRFEDVARDEKYVDIDGRPFIFDESISEALDVVRALAKNIAELPTYPTKSDRWKKRTPLRTLFLRSASPLAGVAQSAENLQLAAGGMQGWDFVRKAIEMGSVPPPEQFDRDAFLRSFYLPLHNKTELKNLFTPGGGALVSQNEILIQLNTESNIKVGAFERPPLTAVIVLDRSGSMSSSDGTSRKRIDWAKDAIEKIIFELGEGDEISLITFNEDPEVVFEGVSGADVRDHRDEIVGIREGGTTDVAKALEQAYGILKQDRESRRLQGGAARNYRVLLLSDLLQNERGLNDGEVAAIAKEYGSKDLGLTVVGVGSNFNKRLADIAFEARGGVGFVVNEVDAFHNFIVEQFDFLVSPVAYDLSFEAELVGVEATLSTTYGINQPESKQGELEIQSTPTVILASPTSGGGGAIVLSYDIL